eukprot:1159798-Pelagomonas_calceolata.AAC.6
MAGSSRLPVTLVHPLCNPRVQAVAKLPGRAIALLVLPLGAAHVKQGPLPHYHVGFHSGAQLRACCKRVYFASLSKQ